MVHWRQRMDLQFRRWRQRKRVLFWRSLLKQRADRLASDIRYRLSLASTELDIFHQLLKRVDITLIQLTRLLRRSRVIPVLKSESSRMSIISKISVIRRAGRRLINKLIREHENSGVSFGHTLRDKGHSKGRPTPFEKTPAYLTPEDLAVAMPRNLAVGRSTVVSASLAPRDLAFSKSAQSDIVAKRVQDVQVPDSIHGNIILNPLFLQFVNTAQFQRLGDLKQLGATDLIYPGASHTRLVHSLGVFSLASKAIHQLRHKQGKELDIDDFDVQTVQLAGLLHDLGHGPFSHTFERVLLPQILHLYNWNHEDMTTRMIDHMVDENNIEIDDGVLKRAKEMISSAGRDARTTSAREKCFLYDIVANARNGIDVDTFDYIVRDSSACGLVCNFKSERLLKTMRVIGDEICYHTDEHLTINNLLLARDSLHQTVYTNRKVKGIELMISDALLYANEVLKIESCVDDPADYCKLMNDSIVNFLECNSDNELLKCRDLISRIRKRELYTFCDEFVFPKDKLDHFKDVTINDIICSQTSGLTLDKEDVVVCNENIDLPCGRINPLGSINFYEGYEGEMKFEVEGVSRSVCCQDKIVQVYSTRPEHVEVVKDACKNYRLKVLGMKAQVHPNT